jgi:hypothetical protein
MSNGVQAVQAGVMSANSSRNLLFQTGHYFTHRDSHKIVQMFVIGGLPVQVTSFTLIYTCGYADVTHHSGPGSTLIRPIYKQKFRWHDIDGSSLGNILSLMVHAAESPTDGRCGVDVFTRPAADLLALIQ